MTTTEAKPKKLTQRQIKQGLAPKVSHAKSPAPPAVISEIHLIPLDRITIKEQPRRELHMDSIEELAQDIEAHGLLQPIIVNPIGDEHYRLVCGERRFRAIQHLKQKAIPAIVSKIGDNELRVIQLAENIQREDMNLRDTAAAIRELFDSLGSLDAVSQRVSKSKPWVCKMVAMSCDKFGWRAKAVLESGLIEDIELLNTLNQIEKQCTYQEAGIAFERAKKGELTRQQARDYLKEHKETKSKQIEQNKADQKSRQDNEAKKEAAREKERKEREEGHGQKFIDYAMNQIDNTLYQVHGDKLDYIEKLTKEQNLSLVNEMVLIGHKGKEAKPEDWITALLAGEKQVMSIELLLMILATIGKPINNPRTLLEMIAAVKKDYQ
jgi:ParB family chromosome partitioning protein